MTEKEAKKICAEAALANKAVFKKKKDSTMDITPVVIYEDENEDEDESTNAPLMVNRNTSSTLSDAGAVRDE